MHFSTTESATKAALCLLLLSRAAFPQAGEDPRIARVEAQLSPMLVLEGAEEDGWSLEERMAHYNVPGVSVAVIENGAIVWAKGYGLADVASGREVTATTLFQAASISKPIGALAALSLVDEGELALDAPINELLTSWKLPERARADGRPVTLRGLLTHTAGISVHGFPGYGPGEVVPSTRGVLDGEGNTESVRAILPAGEQWRYSGGGYTIAQLLVEDVTARPYAEVLRERVLAPLGMTSSTFEQPLPEARWSEAATAYYDSGEPVAGRFHTYPEMAAAGLWTTPTDLARYLIAAQQALLSAEHPVLERDTLKAMLTPGLGGQGLGPGFSESHLRFGHGGANMGFRCDMTALVDGSGGAVIMTNSDAGGGLMRELLFAIADEYGWAEPLPARETVVELDGDDLDAILGRYRSRGDELMLFYEDERLWLVASWDEDPEPVRIYPTSRERYFMRDGQPLELVWSDGGTPETLIIRRRQFARVR